jgi:hypothetical protein
MHNEDTTTNPNSQIWESEKWGKLTNIYRISGVTNRDAGSVKGKKKPAMSCGLRPYLGASVPY